MESRCFDDFSTWVLRSVTGNIPHCCTCVVNMIVDTGAMPVTPGVNITSWASDCSYNQSLLARSTCIYLRLTLLVFKYEHSIRGGRGTDSVSYRFGWPMLPCTAMDPMFSYHTLTSLHLSLSVIYCCKKQY